LQGLRGLPALATGVTARNAASMRRNSRFWRTDRARRQRRVHGRVLQL